MIAYRALEVHLGRTLPLTYFEKGSFFLGLFFSLLGAMVVWGGFLVYSPEAFSAFPYFRFSIEFLVFFASGVSVITLGLHHFIYDLRVSIDLAFVRVRKRGLLGRHHLQEPLACYRGIFCEEEKSVCAIALIHQWDRKKDIELYQSVFRKHLAEETIRYLNLFKLPLLKRLENQFHVTDAQAWAGDASKVKPLLPVLPSFDPGRMLPRKSLDVRPEGTGFRITLTPPPHWGVLVLALLFLGGILMRNFFPGISSHFFLLFLGASAIALLFFYCTREHIRVSEKGIDYHVSLAGFFIQGWSLGYQRITEIALKDHPPFLSLRVKGGEEQYPCVFSVPLAECGWLRECLAYFLLRNEEKGEVGIASAV